MLVGFLGINTSYVHWFPGPYFTFLVDSMLTLKAGSRNCSYDLCELHAIRKQLLGICKE